MPSLQFLHLQGLGKIEFEANFSRLSSLISLDLSFNHIQVIPKEITRLIHLQSLSLSFNEIRQLSDDFGWLPTLRTLNMEGNCIDNIPPSLNLSKGREVRSFLRNKILQDAAQLPRLFEEPDTYGTIRYKEDGSILGASLEKLIQILTTDHPQRRVLIRPFLLAFESCASPPRILKLITIRYTHPIGRPTINKQERTSQTYSEGDGLHDPREKGKEESVVDYSQLSNEELQSARRIRQLAIKFLETWVELRGRTLSDNLVEQIVSFVESQMSEKDILMKERVRKKKEKEEDEEDESDSFEKIVMLLRNRKLRSFESNVSETPLSKSILPEEEISLCTQLTSIHPKELARQITLIERDIFVEIKPDELLNQRWNKSEKKTTAPNVMRYIAHFNRMNRVVATTIVKQRDLKMRLKVLQNWILTAHEAHELSNFNAVSEIYSGLQNSAVHRLKLTWDELPPKSKAIYRNLKQFLSHEDNHSTYRKILKETMPPAIPDLSHTFRDLTYYDDGNADFLRSDSSLINVGKIRMVGSLLDDILKFQSSLFALIPVPSITQLILRAETFSEDRLYEESLICEDRLGRTPQMRGEILEVSDGEDRDIIILHDSSLSNEELVKAEQQQKRWGDRQKILGLASETIHERSGYLMLRENNAWNRHWFCLQYPALYYFKKKIVRTFDVKIPFSFFLFP